MDMEGQPETPKLLVQVRNVLRLHHYSIHTERSYVDWIKRYIHFHQMRCREDLGDGERKIEAFLTDLAVRGKVAASTQNQAMNALVFLYKKVLARTVSGTASPRIFCKGARTSAPSRNSWVIPTWPLR